MAADEIAYNIYFKLLQVQYRNKYEEARDNKWLICIPASEALRGVNIDERFVELHTLQPSIQPGYYSSSDDKRTLSLVLNGNKLTLQTHNEKMPYIITILSEEIGYNTRFQPYRLLIIDRLMSPNIYTDTNDELNGSINLNNKITSLSEAQTFLIKCENHAGVLPQLSFAMAELMREIQTDCNDLESMCLAIRHTIRSQWSTLLTTHPLHRQRDSRFQLLLSSALENYIVSSVHEEIFPIICENFKPEDNELSKHILNLSKLRVTPDQLGAHEDYSIQLPAAVVELAALDNLLCPIEKLICLRSCLDLILAQVKGAIVDFHSHNSDDDEELPPAVTSEDLIPLLMAVVIQAKPLHLVSNIFYMEQLQWTLSPHDPLRYSLITFKATMQQLLNLKIEDLKPRNKKVLRELALKDLILVSNALEQPDRKVTSPLDRELETITAMIEASTRDLPSSNY